MSHGVLFAIILIGFYTFVVILAIVLLKIIDSYKTNSNKPLKLKRRKRFYD